MQLNRPVPVHVLLAGVVAPTLLSCAAASERFIASPTEPCDDSAVAPAQLRVASFNIRAALSSSLEAVAEVIRSLDADVVALQEVDVGVNRTGRVNQAGELASRLGYRYAFAGAIRREGGDYGVALLSRLPLARVVRVPLEAAGAFEPRAAIDARVCAGAVPVRVIAVHSDVFPWSANENARSLASMLNIAGDEDVIVAGDLNAEPHDSAARAFSELGLDDLIGRYDEGYTFLFPKRRIDYIFANKALTEASSALRLEVEVSDHIPIVAELAPPHR
jgi:endonuclease/exonuclease/phosphatase family metal-dependent hydrolase